MSIRKICPHRGCGEPIINSGLPNHLHFEHGVPRERAKSMALVATPALESEDDELPTRLVARAEAALARAGGELRELRRLLKRPKRRAS